MRIETLLARTARQYPAFPAVVDERRSLSYGEFHAEVRRLAAALLLLGVKAGDRVAIVSRNRWEYAACYFAAALTGTVLVPLNWRLNPEELRWIVGDAQAVVVVAEGRFAALIHPLRDALEGVRHWIALDEPPEGWALLSSLVDQAPPLPDGHTPTLAASQEPDWHAELVQMYTSGTTGKPKGALLTHANFAASMLGLMNDFDLRPGQDRFLQVTPLFHVGGALMVVTVLGTGVTLRLLPEFTPGPAARCLTEEGVTHTLMVPAMLQWLFAEPGADQLRFPMLRRVAYGAAPMPVPLLERALTQMQCGFFQGYGLTETAGLLTILRPEDHVLDGAPASLARLASAGREMLGTRIQVVDAEGREVPPGEIGEVVAQGANISPGYWQLPQATRDARREGWFLTGDLGVMDEQGYLTLVDRAKDMVIVGGENVYPREIEVVLADHDSVSDCAVIGIPHAVWGEQVLAFVALKPGRQAPQERELIAHCRSRLARYKCPTRVEFLPSIPRNAAGKIEKAALRQPFLAPATARGAGGAA